MQEMNGLWWSQIEAIVPVPQGSLVYLVEKDMRHGNCSPAPVVSLLGRHLQMGLRATRRRMRALLEHRMVPLPLIRNFTLVPVRVRRGPGPLWGYVVYERAVFYRSVDEPPFRTIVYFDDGRSIGTLLAPGTLRKVWREAVVARRQEEKYFDRRFNLANPGEE